MEVSIMSALYVYLNGTQVNPSELDAKADEKIGESRRMADGTLRYYHVAFKGEWTLTWNGLKETYLSALVTIARLTTSFTFIDYNSVSHTVMILPGGFTTKLSADKVSPNMKRWDISMTLTEV